MRDLTWLQGNGNLWIMGPETRLKSGSMLLFWLVLIVLGSGLSAQQAPPNEPAQVVFDGTKLAIHYDGRLLFQGTVKSSSGRAVQFRTVAVREGDKVNQALTFNDPGFAAPLELSGTVSAGSGAFSCEVDRPTSGPLIVRHVFGMSFSLRNRAVYDRDRDWVFSVDINPKAVVKPIKTGDPGRSFEFNVSGPEIVLRFRPAFYRVHKGLSRFEPWNYQVRRDPIVGWCSWFAFWNGVTEDDIKHTADIISERLRPYGYRYIQMDDGYQRATGLPEMWLEPNSKFPSGLRALAQYIKNKGLIPGIWTNVAFHQPDALKSHARYFVKNPDGSIPEEPWVGNIIDGSNPRALDVMIRPLYRGLRDQGWEYFKLDALRHLRYEGYNRHRDYFEGKGVQPADAFRDVVAAVRGEISNDYPLMACWGIRPELIGLIDACRIGGDGFSYAGLAQYNSFNNVVWQNDPDHIELSREEAYRSTTVTSLTGSLYMLTDKPEVYLSDVVEPARRTVPVLFTLPGQIYEVDPSRIERLGQVNAEVSGSNHRPFDASLTPLAYLYLLEMNRDFENWTILGRTGGKTQRISFADLGLDPSAEFLVYEFWNRTFIGSFVDSFDPGEIDPRFNCQVFCIRKRLDRPQLLATSRHITCGGPDLDSLSWTERNLQGTSRLVGNDDYVLTLFEPVEFELKGFDLKGAELVSNQRNGAIRTITLRSAGDATVNWSARY